MHLRRNINKHPVIKISPGQIVGNGAIRLVGVIPN
jgi:hypothetical protein